MIGLFAKITLVKDPETGKVTLYNAGVLPTFSLSRSQKNRKWVSVVPAYSDTDRIGGLDMPLTNSEREAIGKARTFALNRLGEVPGLRILDEPQN